LEARARRTPDARTLERVDRSRGIAEPYGGFGEEIEQARLGADARQSVFEQSACPVGVVLLEMGLGEERQMGDVVVEVAAGALQCGPRFGGGGRPAPPA